MNGWIKIYREIIDHWIWSNPSYFKAWAYILFRANHKPTKLLIGSTLQEVGRGEFITSRANFAADTGMSEQSARTFLQLLEKDGMIVKKSTSKLTKITICNYDTYQSDQPANHQPATSQQPASNQPVTTDKNEKKVKKVKKFIRPTLDEVKLYCKQRGKGVNPIKWFNHYTSNGWKVGKNAMKDWKAAVRTWEDSDIQQAGKLPASLGTNLGADPLPADYGEPSPSAVPYSEYKKQKSKS